MSEPAKTDVKHQICDEILSIMAVYHEQDRSPSGVDSPGGLEHMGDVWRLFAQWERMLADGPVTTSAANPRILR